MTHTDTERLGLPSGSSMERFMMCPGSFQTEALCPPAPESQEAKTGTKVAKTMETGDDSELEMDEAEIARKLKVLEDETVFAWKRDTGAGECLFIREERFWVRSKASLQPVASAKPDLLVLESNTIPSLALVIDHKSGFLDPTPAPSNWQLRTQALAVWHECPSLRRVRVAWARARFQSIQSYCDYNLDDLRHAERDLLHGLWVAKQPDAQRRPGQWCRYCRAKGFCPEASAWSLLPQISTGTPLKKVDAVAKVALLPPLALAELRKRQPIIKAILEAAEDRLKGLPDDELRAIELERKDRARTEITDIQGVYDTLLAQGLASQWPDLLKLCKLPIGAIEETHLKAFAEKMRVTQQSAKVMLRDLLKPFSQARPYQVLQSISKE